MLRRRSRNPAQRLRFAVQALPRHAREGMLRGIEQNTIIVGAYTDPRTGGICPMLAAHRNGGRTDLASFARAWDRFTGAKRPRLATERELRALHSYIEMSLVTDDEAESLAATAKRIRAERDRHHATATRADRDAGRIRITRRHRDPDERDTTREPRRSRLWSWLVPARRYDEFRTRVVAAEEQLAERRAAEAIPSGAASDKARSTDRHPVGA